MAISNVTTIREALMAELLQDADVLVQRLEQVDAALAEKIEKSAMDAAGKSFLTFKLNFESLIDHNAEKMTEAGRYAAACIGNRLTEQGSRILDLNTLLTKKMRVLVGVLVLVGFLAGALGGFIGAKLAGV